MGGTRKKALVTGGTAGVGLSIVRALIDGGVDVYFVGSNADKGRRAEEELGLPEGHFIQVDLSSLDGTKRMADAFKAKHGRLDLLANVAGVMLPTRQVTAEGHEKTFAIDHLSAFVLCRELEPLLAEAEHGRIVNVSGDPSHLLKPSLDFDNLQLEQGYSLMRAAINAVHAKTVMTQILAEKLAPQGTDVNAFHPGAVKSDLFRHMRFPMSLIFRTARLFMAKASRAGIHACTAESLNGVTGQLFVGTKPRQLSFDADYRGRLWEETLAALPAGVVSAA